MELLLKAEAYIFKLFKDKLSSEYIYHDYLHTLRVVTAVNELINGENILEPNATHLRLAAWFHDSGYIDGCENHEERSCVIFKDFIKENAFENVNIEQVCSLILATKCSRFPTRRGFSVLSVADSSRPRFGAGLRSSPACRHPRQRCASCRRPGCNLARSLGAYRRRRRAWRYRLN